MFRKTVFFFFLVLLSSLLLIPMSMRRSVVAQQGAAHSQTGAQVPAAPAGKTQISPDDNVTPRTMEGYIEQEKPFYEYLLKNHPVFKYEKAGRMVGRYHISDRDEEFREQGGGKDYAKQNNRQVSMTYRLGAESILDLPNRFVGPKKCGECHPAQYEKWERSRHAKVVRFPDEMEEVPGKDLHAGLWGSKAGVLPEGITDDTVFAIIGTPRTKYGFVDAWLVRGTYHVEGGLLRDGTGTLVPGGNQHSRTWAESMTPETVQKIAAFVPGFPTKLEDFGDNGSNVWGMTSYGAQNRESMLFQPATSYCEVCHSFKFDFKSDAELFAALGNAKELRNHTISKGISCEECHGAGGHLYGARGVGMPSNCERCHQRFAWNPEQAKENPEHPFTCFFKSRVPACGTEGSQGFNSAHYKAGIRCTTCHDPHEVTENNWKDSYTVTGLKKQCEDCHLTQAKFAKETNIHAGRKCSSCHMPNMMSCENFGTIQYPDFGGFDTARAAHIWRIVVSPDLKTLNPPPGKDRAYKDGPWRLARKGGKPFVDIQWSCGRTSYMDGTVIEGGGCHSGVQSSQPKDLQFTNQKMIYDRIMTWQTPVKDGLAAVKSGLAGLDGQIPNGKLSAKENAEVQVMINQAREIVGAIEKDGSWGVHAPSYTLQKVNEAKVLVDGAQASLSGKAKTAEMRKP